MAIHLPSSAQEMDAMRESMHRQMLDAVSHDLKTPLATIIGSLEIYERMEGKISAENKTILLNTALTEAYRLDHFITNILDMAKLEAGRVKVKPENCNLRYLIGETLSRLGPKRTRCDITIHSPQDVATIWIDPMLLARALLLILENAATHGGEKPVIELEYGAHDGQGFIRIRDHGPGIPSGKEQEIFHKYTRLAKADHKNAGTGLGLAISREIMALLGGAVNVLNHPQEGAVFTLTFPRHRT